VNRPLGKRQRDRLEAHLSRGTSPRGQPLVRACWAEVMLSQEITSDPDLRETLITGLAGAEDVYQAHRLFLGTVLAEMASGLMIARDEALERLSAALAARRLMAAARAASDLSELGGKAQGLVLFSEFARRAAAHAQSASEGGSNSEKVKQQRDKIRRRDSILTTLLPRALSVGGGHRAMNTSRLAQWMLDHWPRDGPSASDLKAGVRVVSDWVRARRKINPDDFWNLAGPLPKQEGQVVSAGPPRGGSTRSNNHESRHPGIAT